MFFTISPLYKFTGPNSKYIPNYSKKKQKWRSFFFIGLVLNFLLCFGLWFKWYIKSIVSNIFHFWKHPFQVFYRDITSLHLPSGSIQSHSAQKDVIQTSGSSCFFNILHLDNFPSPKLSQFKYIPNHSKTKIVNGGASFFIVLILRYKA